MENRGDRKLKICCLSDLHGYLPEIPTCDLLILAGDYLPTNNVIDQRWWLRDSFGPWLYKIAERGIKTIGIAGNHDFIWEKRPDLVPKLDWTYLQDSGTVFDGLNIYGSPFQPIFGWWSFNATEDDLSQKWDLIPHNTDILIVHGPPAGIADCTAEGDHPGSPSLLAKIEEIRPRLVVCGHIHESRGVYGMCGDHTILVNASYLDGSYKPWNKPMIEVEI